MAILARHLEQRRQTLQLLVAEKDRELVADQTVTDVVVPVAVRPERRLRVVHVQAAEPVEADRIVELAEHAVELGALRDVVPRGEEVAGVETDPEARMPIQRVEKRG